MPLSTHREHGKSTDLPHFRKRGKPQVINHQQSTKGKTLQPPTVACNYSAEAAPAFARSFCCYAEPASQGYQTSRRVQAIKATGIIRPLRIAEIARTAGKSVGAQWKPCGIGQVRAGLNHHDDIGGAGDVEPELIGPNAWAGRADLPLGGNQYLKSFNPS